MFKSLPTVTQMPRWLLIPVLLAGFTACLHDDESDSESRRQQTDPAVAQSRFDFANSCFALVSRDNGASVTKNAGYTANSDSVENAEPFFMKPSGLGAYLLFDSDGQFLAISDEFAVFADELGGSVDQAGNAVSAGGDLLVLAEPATPLGDGIDEAGTAISAGGEEIAGQAGTPAVGAADTASDLAEWLLEGDADSGFTLTNTATGQSLAVSAGNDELVLGEPGIFDLHPHAGCADFPEAGLNASGEPFSGTNPDGTVFGFADTHVHVTSYERMGGRVQFGDPFHRFGIEHALPNCEVDHGPSGTMDFIGNFQREGSPAGMHATDGWPTFSEWPVHDTLTHQQTYYLWIKRAWMAGLRLMVNHTAGDEILCQLTPLKDEDCDEMEAVRLQVQRIREMQDYIDAQEGGPGKGWFRIIDNPADARQVIEEGKLAVILGIESNKIFNCGEFLDDPECTRADIDAAIEEFRDLGIRSIFPLHHFDNAIGGAGLFGPSELILNVFNKLETGHYFSVEECPEQDMGANLESFGQHLEEDNELAALANQIQTVAVPTYPQGPHCNARGLTELGEYFIDRLIDSGIIIEIDHSGARLKNQMLAIAEELDVPVISGHMGTGGVTTDTQISRVFGVRGLVSPFNDPAPVLNDKILRMASLNSGDHFFGVGFASDSGGLAAQPQPREDADERPLTYPFKSFDGRVTFDRQVTGDRTYDLNTDGVAHYGLYADLVADMQQQENSEQVMDLFFRSAEAYLQMWERIMARSRSR